MNLRLSKDSIRFRISKDEFEKLRSDQFIEEEIDLPDGSKINFSIKGVENQEAGLVLNFLNSHFNLEVSGSAIDDLSRLPPAKDCGIYADILRKNGGGVTKLSLEIDLFSVRNTKL